MKKNIFYAALAAMFVTSGILHYSHASATTQIIVCSIAIVLAAAFLGKATESVAHYAGQRMGGFLNATFGNAAELIIAIFLVKEGLFEMVKASITGSIIGNMLLVLGLSLLLGGLKFKVQRFNVMLAGHNASLMLLAVIVLFIPAVFAREFTVEKTETFSLAVAGFLILAYLLWLLFSMVTHKNELADVIEAGNGQPSAHAHEEPAWSKRVSILFLFLATAMVAFVSEWLVGNLEDFSTRFGLSELFVGAFLIAIIGNAAEHSAAIFLAMKNKIGAAVEIAIGSSLQIALFVAPVLIFVSYFMGNTMDIVFTTYELVAIGVAAFITKSISRDGTTNWYEGVLLLLVYIILGIAFFMV
ncbi:calcium/proton exchanger [Marinicrinis sediminis]|uniref:Ca(2+)/H(+) antiporter n=1 Tax=Marinicrinis sediminis TaxID=1652465 RepID=A0ABW5R5B4_9BACL